MRMHAYPCCARSSIPQWQKGAFCAETSHTTSRREACEASCVVKEWKVPTTRGGTSINSGQQHRHEASGVVKHWKLTTYAVRVSSHIAYVVFSPNTHSSLGMSQITPSLVGISQSTLFCLARGIANKNSVLICNQQTKIMPGKACIPAETCAPSNAERHYYQNHLTWSVSQQKH